MHPFHVKPTNLYEAQINKTGYKSSKFTAAPNMKTQKDTFYTLAYKTKTKRKR